MSLTFTINIKSSTMNLKTGFKEIAKVGALVILDKFNRSDLSLFVDEIQDELLKSRVPHPL
jgi:hypothetical protein